jgi:hypothetical protein
MPRLYAIIDDSVNASHVKAEGADDVASEEGVSALKFLSMSFFLVCCLMTLSVARLYKGDVRMMNACGAAGGVRVYRESRSIRRKPSDVPLYPPQIHLGSNPGHRGG